MKYSRSQLNRLGSDLYAEGVDAFKRSEAIRIVSDWRMTHLLPLLRSSCPRKSTAQPSSLGS